MRLFKEQLLGGHTAIAVGLSCYRPTQPLICCRSHHRHKDKGGPLAGWQGSNHHNWERASQRGSEAEDKEELAGGGEGAEKEEQIERMREGAA